MSEDPKITALAPWFGSNRMLAPAVAEECRGRPYCGVLFAGGMSEVRHIESRTIHVNDKHELIINLARVVADPFIGPLLYRELKRMAFHPHTLQDCRAECIAYMSSGRSTIHHATRGILSLARAYFVCCWMGRSAKAGTGSEFTGKLPVRYTVSGGDSNVRYRSAVSSIMAWRRTFTRCTFDCLDVFTLLPKFKDDANTVLYSDQPFPGPGDAYMHGFNERQTRQLAVELAGYKQARVVCRFYDHPLVRECYPPDRWTWRFLAGRDQANSDTKPEVLIINGPSNAKA